MEMVENRDNDQRFKNFPDNIEWSETVVDGTWLRKGRFFLKENRKKKDDIFSFIEVGRSLNR